jgi:2-hydroxychromene-2-carboxylate isomerase
MMRGAVAAQQLGCFALYVDTVMAAMWKDSKDMGEAKIVRQVLDSAGLDSATLLALADDPDVKAELMANTEAAAKRGAFGVPTFFVGEEMFFGKERLAQVEAALTKS